MVCRNADSTAFLKDLVHEAADTFIYCFHCCYGGFHDPRMPHHVRVCKIQYNEIIKVLIQCFLKFFRDNIGTHLRL